MQAVREQYAENIALTAKLAERWPDDGVPALRVFDAVDSTNDLAKRLIRAGANVPFIVLAGRQSNGRGRRGRSFYSPEGGLYLTAVRAVEGDERDELLHTPGLAVCRAAVAAAAAIEAALAIETGIKWINDLVVDGRKVGGILTETVENASVLLIGVGVNVAAAPFPPELSETAGSLLDSLPERDVLLDLAAELGARLLQPVPAETVIEAYEKRLILTGRLVRVSGGKADGLTARVRGVGADGSLIAEASDGTILTLRNGEVRLDRSGHVSGSADKTGRHDTAGRLERT